MATAALWVATFLLLLAGMVTAKQLGKSGSSSLNGTTTSAPNNVRDDKIHYPELYNDKSAASKEEPMPPMMQDAPAGPAQDEEKKNSGKTTVRVTNVGNRRSKQRRRGRKNKGRKSIGDEELTQLTEDHIRMEGNGGGPSFDFDDDSINNNNNNHNNNNNNNNNNNDDDYDYYDDGDDVDDSANNGVYTIQMMKDDILDYTDGLVGKKSGLLAAELSTVKQQVSKLEEALKKSTDLIKELETRLRLGGGGVKSTKFGDLRLLSEDGDGSRSGYLQFFTGNRWGFVCDDFFDKRAGQIACQQLGFPGNGVKLNEVSSTPERLASWQGAYEIVLDDVQCQAGHTTIASCQHARVGQHDCVQTELVHLQCGGDGGH